MNQVTGRDTVAVLAGSGGAVYRLRRYLAKYGPRAAVHRALDAGRCALVLDETHVWYELGTGNERPRVDLPVGTTFVRADAAALPLIERLPTVSQAEAKRRVAAGNDLWFVLDGRQPAFACWTFSRSMPMLSAPGGELVLAAGVVCLEDSVTAPEHRGRGLGPAAWTLLADEMRRQGVSWLITKVAEDNTPSRKAVVKAGFGEIGLMRYRRVLGRERTTVTGASGPNGEYLRGLLG